MKETTEKRYDIEALRGVASFIVVTSHLCLTFFPYLHAFGDKATDSTHPIQNMLYHMPFGFVYSGTAAVFVFFVMSGFILSNVALNTDKLGIGRMFIKRCPRLMLPALCSCIIAYLLFLGFEIDKTELSAWINQYGDFEPTFLNSIYSSTIGLLFASGKNEYNPVLWTLKVELIGSFVIYFLCLIPKKKYAIPFIILLVAISAYLIFQKEIRINMGLGLIAMLCGYVYYVYGRKIPHQMSVLILLIGLYFAGIHAESHSYAWFIDVFDRVSYSVGNFISGLLIVYGVLMNPKFLKATQSRIFDFLGKVSFSVYLIHVPLISVCSVSLFKLLHSVFSYNQAAVISSILSFPVIYLVAALYYKLIDAHSIRLSSKCSSILIPIAKK